MSELQQALRARRKASMAKLAAEAAGDGPVANLKQISGEIADLDAVRAAVAPKVPAWTWTLGLTTACLVAIGIAYAVGFRWAETRVDAVVAELSFKNRDRQALIAPPVDMGGGTLRLTGWSRHGARQPPLVLPERGEVGMAAGSGLHDLTLTGGARLTVTSNQDSCYGFAVRDGRLLGTLSIGPSRPAATPPNEVTPPHTGPFEADDTTAFHFCAPRGLRLIADRVSDVLIESAYVHGPPPVSLPSIMSGTIGVPVVAKEIKLKETDRIRLTEVIDGHLLLVPDKRIRIIFAGTVKQPVLSGVSGATDLRPNVLEYLRGSPALAFLTGAFVAFWGFAWNIKQRLLG